MVISYPIKVNRPVIKGVWTISYLIAPHSVTVEVKMPIFKLQLFASLMHVISGEPVPLTGFVALELKKFVAGAVIAAVDGIRQSITVT